MREFLLLSAAWVLPVSAAAAAVSDGTTIPASLPGILVSSALPNFLIALSLVLLFIFGIYAYASLARFAPYHEWIYLYLVSFSGIVWAFFLVNTGGSPADSLFLITTVTGVNLIVHILRYDRIELPFLPGKEPGPAPRRPEDRKPVPLPGFPR
ncbi:MAG: hypothetical protein ACM3X8_03020 [Methanomicrobiales archaeon]